MIEHPPGTSYHVYCLKDHYRGFKEGKVYRAEVIELEENDHACIIYNTDIAEHYFHNELPIAEFIYQTYFECLNTRRKRKIDNILKELKNGS